MRITITGASGYVGGNLVRALLDRHDRDLQIRALVYDGDRALAGLPRERLEIVHGDLLDPHFTRRALRGSDVVYHLAARISLDPRDAEAMERVNVGATKQVLRACRAGGVRRLVYFSSIHALSTRPFDRICDETRALSDEDEDAPAYDQTKARALRAVREAVAAGLDAVIVHPTGIIGPHDHGPSALGAGICQLWTGAVPAVVAGGFDFVDVRDVVAGAIAAETRGRTGESYLLSGEWISVAAFAEHVARAGGRACPRITMPMGPARIAAHVMLAWSRLGGAPPPLMPASLHALRHYRSISHAKATRELGYAPRPIAESIADTLAWMRRAGMLPEPRLAAPRLHLPGGAEAA